VKAVRRAAGLIAVVVMGQRAAAFACDCPERALRDSVQAAEVVALVILSEVRRAGDGTLQARAVVEDVLRGPAPGRTWAVRWGSPTGGRCPPAKLSPGRWWVLGRVERDGRLGVSRCDPKTRVVSEVEVRARRAELVSQLAPVDSAETARAVAAEAARPLLRAALEDPPLDLAQAEVTEEARGRWVVRWRARSRVGPPVDAEVLVRADGSAQVVRVEAGEAAD
jgi:hypothetical protein